jgi:hypothetical protein
MQNERSLDSMHREGIAADAKGSRRKEHKRSADTRRYIGM